MLLRPKVLIVAVLFLAAHALASWQLCEETAVEGKISGTIKKGTIIKMQSGSIYEVADLTLQLVLELSPEATVLTDGAQFKLSIKGFAEPVICNQLIPPGTRRPPLPAEPAGTSQPSATVRKEVTLDQLIQPTRQAAMGLQKLSADEREQLRRYLVDLYLQGVEYGSGTRPPVVAGHEAARSTLGTPSAIESRIDGEFNGWSGETVAKLINGQIWQQNEFYYHYHYSFMPKVLIYPSGGAYKMKVDGIDKAVAVTQLR